MPGYMKKGSSRGSMPTNEKADMNAIGRLVKYCRKYIPAVIAAVLCAIGGTAGTIFGPGVISKLMNTITEGIMSTIDMAQIGRIALWLVILYGTGTLLGYIQQFITTTVTVKISRSLRGDIDRKINRLPLRFFDTSTKGDILSRITNDVDTVSQTLSQSAANLMSSAVLFVGVIFMMFSTNVLLSLVAIGTSLIGFVFMAFILSKSRRYFNLRQELLGKMNGQIEEVFTNHTVVTAFGAEDAERGIFSDTNGRLYESDWKSQCLSGLMMPIMSFSGNLAYVLIFAVGVSLIVKGSTAVDLGVIVAFTIYAKLFTSPLQTFSQAMTSLQLASAASRRVFEILDAQELEDESGKDAVIEDVRGSVEFRDVSFGYTPEKTVIRSFSAALKPGQKVAIVGPTGAGKTTVVNLLMRFYEVGSGDILIDGVSVKDMKRETVHDLFDMILQDTWLFSGTVRENLVYNQPSVTDSELDRICESVGLGHFISTLPQGYDTPLSDSLQLSEGQKQQLTIARAMVQNSPLLILDEATSSVDSRTELVIQRAMDELTKGRTSFIIAHRLSTIRDADVILVMRDGDIVESGTHSELLEKGGFYAELYNSQFAPV